MTKQRKILNRIVIFAFAVVMAFLGAVPSFASDRVLETAGESPEVTATSVILMDAGSGDILYQKKAHEKRDPASITKILNCLVCLDELDFDEEVTVDIETNPEGSSMKLKKGETLRVKDIVYGMMLWSANDGAEFLGHLAGDGDMEKFCRKMNKKAKELGARDTKYVNPNGLNNGSVNNITTAYDIAVIVREAMKDERFREIVGTQEYVIEATNKSKKRLVTNSNRCLWSDLIKAAAKGDKDALDKYTAEYKSNPYNYISDDEAAVREAAQDDAKLSASLMYEPCIGVKTGYSSTAGDCFAGFAAKDDTEMIAVVLNAPHTKNKFQDAKKLWKYAYKHFKTYVAQEQEDFEYQLNIRHGELREVALGIEDDLGVTVLKDEDPTETVTTEIELFDEKPTAPVKKGQVMGKLVCYENGDAIKSVDLVSLETSGEGGILSYIGFADEDRYQFFLLLLLLLIIILAIIRRQARRKAARRRRQARRQQTRVHRNNQYDQHSQYNRYDQYSRDDHHDRHDRYNRY